MQLLLTGRFPKEAPIPSDGVQLIKLHRLLCVTQGAFGVGETSGKTCGRMLSWGCPELAPLPPPRLRRARSRRPAAPPRAVPAPPAERAALPAAPAGLHRLRAAPAPAPGAAPGTSPAGPLSPGRRDGCALPALLTAPLPFPPPPLPPPPSGALPPLHTCLAICQRLCFARRGEFSLGPLQHPSPAHTHTHTQARSHGRTGRSTSVAAASGHAGPALPAAAAGRPPPAAAPPGPAPPNGGRRRLRGPAPAAGGR